MSMDQNKKEESELFERKMTRDEGVNKELLCKEVIKAPVEERSEKVQQDKGQNSEDDFRRDLCVSDWKDYFEDLYNENREEDLMVNMLRFKWNGRV